MSVDELVGNRVCDIVESKSAFFYTPPIDRGAESLILRDPIRSVEAYNESDLDELLEESEEYIEGEYKLLLLSYEVGYYFDASFSQFRFYSLHPSQLL